MREKIYISDKTKHKKKQLGALINCINSYRCQQSDKLTPLTIPLSYKKGWLHQFGIMLYLLFCLFCLIDSCHFEFFLFSFTNSWYFGDVPRAEAEKLLMISTNLPGTFLIRVSSSQKDALSLSLRDSDGIKHYRIRKMDQGGGFFITSRAVFPTVAVSFI